jgi:hypothetical protein
LLAGGATFRSLRAHTQQDESSICHYDALRRRVRGPDGVDGEQKCQLNVAWHVVRIGEYGEGAGNRTPAIEDILKET